MNARILILVCLLALFIAAPAYAADIIVNESCSLHDAIIAANTDAPAGNCPAGSGADTIAAVAPIDSRSYLRLPLYQPLPPISSTISIRSGIPGESFYLVYFSDRNPAIDVASGGYLKMGSDMRVWNNDTAGGHFLLVRRGGRVDLPGTFLALVPVPCGAIYNQGTLNVWGTQFAGKSALGNRAWTPAPGATIMYNNGGTVSHGDNRTNSFSAGDLFLASGDCVPAGLPAAVSRPAPECKLEPQLQAGDRALRRGGSYSNLRAEAGLSGERVGRIEGGAVVDVIEGPVEAGGYNWYRVTADDDALEGWVAEAPARSFNCAYYFVGFDGELPPAAPDPIPERQACDMAEPLAVGGWAVIAGKTNINYRAEPGLGGSRSGTLAPGTVLELLDGPEESNGYEWWQARNIIEGIEGWLAQGGAVSSGECLRWLLPLETEDAMDDESDMDESADEMMDEEDDDTEPEESAQEDAADSSP